MTKLSSILYKSQKSSRSFKGQGAVEFALIAPVLFLLVFGMIEVGRLLFIYGAITNAAREAARYGSATGVNDNNVARYNDCDGIRNAAISMGFLSDLQPGDITIEFDTGPGTTRTAASCSPATNDVHTGSRIVVTVNGVFDSVVPIVPLQGLVLTSTSARTIIASVSINVGTAIVPPTVDNSIIIIGNTNTPTMSAAQIQATQTSTAITATAAASRTQAAAQTLTATQWTLTPTKTLQYTQTFTPTPTKTATATLTPSPSMTWTATNTATATSTPVLFCLTSAGTKTFNRISIGQNNKADYSVNIINSSNYPITITGITLTWPVGSGDPGQAQLGSITLGGTEIWKDNQGSSATGSKITSFKTSPIVPITASGGTGTNLRFNFQNDFVLGTSISQFSVIIEFNTGCNPLTFN
jgi:Flp pilus assembly protein TadG